MTSSGFELPRGSTDHIARVRALYEEGIVPVHEIARLAGVSERMIYKYVAEGGWKRRQVSLDDRRTGLLTHGEAQTVSVAQARRARMQAERAMQAQLRMLDTLMGAVVDLAKWEREAAPSPSRRARRLASTLADAIFAAMARLCRFDCI